MVREEKVLIVIPALNEENNISGVIKGVRENLNEALILVVDDGSTDATAEAARIQGAKVVLHPFNLGYGAALQTGYKYAIMNGYKYVVQMDGDGQHHPEYAKDLLDELIRDKADIVIGSRFVKKGRYREPIFRKVGRAIFSSLVSAITDKRITDPTSGYRAMNRKAVKFCTSRLYPTDYPDADMILVFHRAGFRVKEIPVTMTEPDRRTSMHRGISVIYYCFKMCLSILLNLMRKPNT